MYASQYHTFSSLGRSHSHGFLPDLDAPYLTSTQPSMNNEMEERQRLEREKQKLFFGSTMDVHSPIQSYSKPTDVTRINHNSAFDGLYVPFGPSDLYEDPWASRKKETVMEWPVDIMPPQPEMNKQNSYVNPFHTEVAPSLVFPVDAPPQHHISPSSSLDDPVTPVSFIMSDEEEDIQQPNKRQRGEHSAIYVKQEPQDQDIINQQQQPYVDYLQPQQQQQTFIQTLDLPQTYNNMATTLPPLTPFTLQEQQTPSYPTTVYPSQPITTSAPVSPPAAMMDADSDDEAKRKRKTTKRKAQPIGTHAIENTGAPVKMAKYLHVDGMTTQVWIEHAQYQENDVTTDIRLIMYAGAFNGVVVHAGDVGERIVCNRRSNISREFGQYASPTEKILIRVPSEHRPLGQTGNVLTGYGLIRFMQSKKMRKPENQRYRRWLLHHVYSILTSRPFTFPKGHALECETVPSTPFTEADFSH